MPGDLCSPPSAPAAVATIATPRLILRARIPDDAVALFPSLSDPALMTWWSRPPFADIDELRENFAVREGSAWRSWAITLAESDRAIGFLSAGERRSGVSEIGYFLARETQGQGIAREAVTALIDQLFAEGQRRLFADTDPDNRGSIALLQRLGFSLEGHLRGEWHTHIGIRDSLIFGLLADEWDRGSPQPAAGDGAH